MNEINFIIPDQYGYSAGYVYYSKYLCKKGYKVTIHCRDEGLTKIKPNNKSRINYFNIKSNNLLYYLIRLILNARNISKQNSNNIIILKYFPFCSLVTLFNNRGRFVLDIRTNAINKSRIKRSILDFILRIDSRFFKKGFILSELMKRKLKVGKRFNLLPLGADIISTIHKEYNEKVNLIYVGTLNFREIDKTITGLKLIKNKLPKDFQYDIIGYGSKKTERKIVNLIDKYNFSKNIHFIGRKNHLELKDYFDKANIGVAFIPITDYYDNQPSTKIFEYGLSGLFSIATNTSANREIINESNGILHEDTPEGFANAILKFLEIREKIEDIIIRKSLQKNSWEYIVEYYLLPVIHD